MTPDCLPAALFTAALLSRRKDLNHRVRSSIISHVPAFDIHSLDDAAEALNMAFLRADASVRTRWRLTAKALDTFSRKADEWLHGGIFVLTREDLNAEAVSVHELPPVLFAQGDRSVLQRPAAAILNSRKPRRITPDDKWLAETKRQVQIAIGEGFAIVSSYGNIPYCVVSRLSRGHPMIVACDDVLPSMTSEKEALDFLSAYQDLFDFEHTLFISPFPPGPRPSQGVRSLARDHLASALASALLVAEVRKGGNMQRIIDIASKRNGMVIRHQPGSSFGASFDKYDPVEIRPPAEFGVLESRGLLRCARNDITGACHCEEHSDEAISIEDDTRPHLGQRELSLRHAGATQGEAGPLASWFIKKTDGNAHQLDRKTVPPRADALEEIQLVDLQDLQTDLQWLIHYTRSWPGPWPGQTIAEYCQSLIDGNGWACHTAFDTLARILEERLIRASNRLTRGPYGVVSFSECLPQELAAFIKWRKGLCRWSFEPYGIALPRESLAEVKAEPVIYGSREDFQHLPDDRKHLFQTQRSSFDDWTVEREWRIRGDLSLSGAIFQEIVAIVSTPDEARALAREFDCKVALAGVGRENGARSS